jgi:NADH-quinone oxidoreductase subunit A
MTTLVFFILVFLVVSIVFLFAHMMMGKVIRPAHPEPDKLTIYECGEPTIGSAWVQFDLRYYVVALLFVIFDVEVAFFFPWAIVYGKATDLAQAGITQSERENISKQLQLSPPLPLLPNEAAPTSIGVPEASKFAWIAIADIAVFFGVLLVGFAYLWKRGDIDWVKTVMAEDMAEPVMTPSVLPKPTVADVLIGSGATKF